MNNKNNSESLQLYKSLKRRNYEYTEVHCEVFHKILSDTFSFQLDRGYSKYVLTHYGISIFNPFYNDNAQYEVNPIKEYNKTFLSSNYMNLLNKIKSELGENPSQEEIDKCITDNINSIKEYEL